LAAKSLGESGGHVCKPLNIKTALFVAKMAFCASLWSDLATEST
jgi:hypothetical protein